MLRCQKTSKNVERDFTHGGKMNNNLTDELFIANLIEKLETCLTELTDEEYKNEYVLGEWYAYIECLEIIANWKKAKKYGLDYDPEKRFNII